MNLLFQSKKTALLALVLSAATTAQPAWSLVTGQQIQDIIAKAKVLPPDFKVNAEVRDTDVLISTYRAPGASDKDCKIDAILIAHKIVNAESHGISKIKISLYDTQGSGAYTYVEVHLGDIRAYAKNLIDENELLSSIDLNNQSPPRAHRGRPKVGRYNGSNGMFKNNLRENWQKRMKGDNQQSQ